MYVLIYVQPSLSLRAYAAGTSNHALKNAKLGTQVPINQKSNGLKYKFNLEDFKKKSFRKEKYS
jgi:hypothetical protein